TGYSEGSSLPAPARFAGRLLAGPLRQWDRRTAARPDVLVANSNAVRERIRRFWDRPAQVIYPPVDIAEFPLSTRDDGFLLVAARLLRHRRIDLAVDAARTLGRPLVICGDGPERRALEHRAGPDVRFEGHVPRARLVELVRTCRAYLVPGEEDFGIAPVEAMAAGKPVVALARGGAAESVTDGVSGALYATLSADALAAAIKRLDDMALDPAEIRAGAQRFDRSAFRACWRALFNRLDVDPAFYAAAD
ncbi:MAG: glycosyltransferase, partial [Chloroflexota bacterium]